MAKMIGRNLNSNDVASVNKVEINSVNATTIALPNDKRIYLSVFLDPSNIDVNVFIRLYPASDDNIKQGEILTRVQLGNANLFNPNWVMLVDNPYHGEISAISDSGTFDINITEY